MTIIEVSKLSKKFKMGNDNLLNSKYCAWYINVAVPNKNNKNYLRDYCDYIIYNGGKMLYRVQTKQPI